jgi:hypothetical protein
MPAGFCALSEVYLPLSSWSVCSVKRRFSCASASISPSGCGPDRLLLPFTTQLLFPEVRRDPFRCLISCIIAMISPSTGGGSASTLCFILRQVGHTIGDSGFCGTLNSPDWLFSVSSFPTVKAGRRVPRSSAMS